MRRLFVLLFLGVALLPDATAQDRPEKATAEAWTLTGPLGETPKRVTDALPLSHQSEVGVWVKYDPMSDEFDKDSLDTGKWVRNMAWWKGRQPALFSDILHKTPFAPRGIKTLSLNSHNSLYIRFFHFLYYRI